MQQVLGPNLLGANLTATLLDINYTALPPAIQTELTSFNDEIGKEFKQLERSVKLEEPKMKITTFEEAPSPLRMNQKESLSGQGATSKEPVPQQEAQAPAQRSAPVGSTAPKNAGTSTPPGS